MTTAHQNRTFIADLQHETILTIEGPDASKFLQGQVTCDIRAITQKSSLGAHCTHKGRMLFSFLALASSPEKIYLRLPHEQSQSALAALHKYIIFSKAKAEKISDDCLQLGIWGPDARSTITSTFGHCPKARSAFIQTEKHTVIEVDDSRFECWLHSSNTIDNTSTLSKLQQNTAPSNFKHWQLEDIQSGIGHVYAPNTELFIPQMLNYQTLGAISFNKGCYTGQEIVARMKYHGKIKRHMYRVRGETSSPPPPGAPIYSTGGERSVGSVVIASQIDSGFEALLVAKASNVETQTLFLDIQQQQKLTLLELPYAVDEE